MLRNYFKTAIRNLLRHKSNSFVNIAGLMVGFAAFFIIFLVVEYEQSFDNFHANSNNIYRIVRIGKDPVNPEYRAGVPFPVTLGLRLEVPQLKNTAAIYGDKNVQVNIMAADGAVVKKFKEKVLTAEPQFFDMFNFTLAEGNSKTALSEPNAALLTKEIATKYFGDWKKAKGNIIKVYGMDMKVTGILNNPPTNTDFPMGVVLSYATLRKNLNPDDWSSIDDANYCFVQLNDKNSVEQFKRSLATFTDKHIKPVNAGYNLSVQPLNEMHFDSRYGNFNEHTFSKELILALQLIGIFLLVIACVNFINLTTAQAINRAREVGVRKVLGSNKTQLVLQFLGETGITAFIAMLCSFGIVFLCLPFVNNLLSIQLTVANLFAGNIIIFIIAAWAAVTFLSGFYPALVLSGFKPVSVLKSAVISHNRGISFRRVLVVFQFVIAQALIIGTLVVVSQMNYFRTTDMGFTKDAIINAGFPGDSLSRTKTDLLRNEINKITGVQDISFSTFAPSSDGGWYTDLQTENTPGSKKFDMVISMKPADANYFKLYNLKLVAGRAYFPSDTMREFVVNETVIKNLGIRNPADAIGKRINVNGKFCPIAGVVKDFHNNSLRDPIGSVVLLSNKGMYGTANIKINMSQSKNVIASLQKTWSKYYPDFVFEYSFLDQTIADYYKQESQIAQLYKIFSGIAIFISCLGLYGLIAFMAVQRRKEIGIRKVLGAPVRDIVIMLSKEFTILIAIAFLIAAPIAWYFMHQWLQQYTYRIPLGAWFFIVTIVCALLISWLTVGYTAIKAAVANPVKSLRTE